MDSSKAQVILTRDIFFDEHIFFNGKPECVTTQIADEMNSLIVKIQLPENEAINIEILEDDKIKNSLININDSDDELITDFNNKKILNLQRS